MNTTALTVIIVIAVIIIVLIAFFVFRQGRQRRRQERAREEYGSEFERVAEERGSEREAEQELRERRERMEGEIQPLSEESRRRYDEQWQQVERTFVDDPRKALDDADRVVAEILTERNFPTDTRQEASEGLGVMHPGVVEDFREAQRTYQDAAGAEGEGGLEKMRQAIQKYRSVYERVREE